MRACNEPIALADCRTQCWVLQHSSSKKDRSIMNNNYETPEVFEFGRAQRLIQGQKIFDECDVELGPNFWTIETDIDESDE